MPGPREVRDDPKCGLAARDPHLDEPEPKPQTGGDRGVRRSRAHYVSRRSGRRYLCWLVGGRRAAIERQADPDRTRRDPVGCPLSPEAEARPQRLTTETQEAICKAVEVGATRATAAQLAGLAPDTLARWIARGCRGHKKDAPHVRLVKALEVADARFRARHLQVVDLAAIDGDWKAAAWLLEHRAREESAEQGEAVRDRAEVLRILSVQARGGDVGAARVLLAATEKELDDVTEDKLDELSARRSARLAG